MFAPISLVTRRGAADFKVGLQNRIPLFQMRGYKQANISWGLLNILKFAVVVLMNKYGVMSLDCLLPHHSLPPSLFENRPFLKWHVKNVGNFMKVSE